MKKLLLPLILSAFLVPISASATTQDLIIGESYSTGYDSSTDTALGAGDADLYFSLLSSTSAGVTASSPVVASPIPGAWYQPTGIAAQWISPSENQTYPTPVGSPEGDLPGTYTYTALLSTDFQAMTSVTLTGSFAGDNGVALQIAGFSVTGVPAPAYGALTPFSYTFTINSGVQATPIAFVVNNQNDTLPDQINPTGLIVSNLKIVSNSAPEPSTWALMFGGLGLLVFAGRIRSFAKL